MPPLIRCPKAIVVAQAAAVALLAGCDAFGPEASDFLPPDPITELPRSPTPPTPDLWSS
jgi:hypothetical protein